MRHIPATIQAPSYKFNSSSHLASNRRVSEEIMIEYHVEKKAEKKIPMRMSKYLKDYNSLLTPFSQTCIFLHFSSNSMNWQGAILKKYKKFIQKNDITKKIYNTRLPFFPFLFTIIEFSTLDFLECCREERE